MILHKLTCIRLCLSLLLVLLGSSHALAEQKLTIGHWDAHYMVINSTFLTPEIAKKNGIVRSKFNALVNISILDELTKTAQDVAITGTARNLLGTTRTLVFRQVKEGDAIYYLAELPFRDQEQFRFNIDITKGNEKEVLSFNQKMYVEE